LYYVISRTDYFVPKQQGGTYETRYLTILDLWEVDQTQARRFTRYPTTTLKKLTGQGITNMQADEVYEFENVEPAPPVAAEPKVVQQILEVLGPTETKFQRGYVHLGRASNGAERLQKMNCQDAVSLSCYNPEGSNGPVWGQVFMCWYRLRDGRVMPSLEAFGESWSALGKMQDVIQALATHDPTTFTPAILCTLLHRRGFQDVTN